jgi:hypothetical protein
MANIYDNLAPNFNSAKVMKRKYFGKDMAPNMSKVNKKKPVKVTQKEISIEETPTGNIGSVDFNTEVAASAPDMGRTNIPAPVEERSFNLPKDEGSRFSSSNPMGMKRGGSVSSASSRADGCCVRGKTRGKMV